jgi:hypothetical protein
MNLPTAGHGSNDSRRLTLLPRALDDLIDPGKHGVVEAPISFTWPPYCAEPTSPTSARRVRCPVSSPLLAKPGARSPERAAASTVPSPITQPGAPTSLACIGLALGCDLGLPFGTFRRRRAAEMAVRA